MVAERYADNRAGTFKNQPRVVSYLLVSGKVFKIFRDTITEFFFKRLFTANGIISWYNMKRNDLQFTAFLFQF